MRCVIYHIEIGVAGFPVYLQKILSFACHRDWSVLLCYILSYLEQSKPSEEGGTFEVMLLCEVPSSSVNLLLFLLVTE